MKLDPILPLWVLIPLMLAGVGACIAAAKKSRRRFVWSRRALAVVLLAGIALRPGAANAQGASVTTDLDVYFLVDRTASIVAEDYDGRRPRLEGVKADLIALARDLPGARYALIGFDNNVVDLMPLTNDLDAFRVTVEILHPEMTTYSTGSSPRLPVEQVGLRLRAAADQDPDRRRVLVIVTDGEETAEEAASDSFAPLADLIDGGVVLGYGTETGGQMREWRGITGPAGAPLIQDPATGTAAISRIDETNLRDIAAELKVSYVHRDGPGGIDAVVGELGTGRGEQVSGSQLTVTEDRGWLLAWPLLVIALVEIAAVVVELARTSGTRPLRSRPSAVRS